MNFLFVQGRKQRADAPEMDAPLFLALAAALFAENHKGRKKFGTIHELLMIPK